MPVDAEEFLSRRRASSDARLDAFRIALKEQLGGELDELIGDHTTIYATGSGGRGELSQSSDLDAFLVTNRPLRKIDEVRLQTALLRAMRSQQFEDPSNDAAFLKLHTSKGLIERLGEPRDDADNTLTVRMLLLLESRVLVGENCYNDLFSASLDAYWQNDDDHRSDYLPIILINDIIRYWRILLLNYEFKTAKKRAETTAGGARERVEADRRLRSYKLRFSRCLMCYSSVARLLAEAYATLEEGGTAHVSRDVVQEMVRQVPLERLDRVRIRASHLPEVDRIVRAMRELYARFLEQTNQPKAELLELFSDEARRKPVFETAEVFGERMFQLLELLGRNNPLYRYVVL